jgi:predicted NBD/HSP70 family sugar kinase
VFIENDANCAALYELLLNPEINNALVLTTGTGVGGAIIIDHKLFKGSHNAAGEFGVGLSHYDNEHYMNISSQASTHSIGQRYTKLSNHSTSVEEIMSLYDSSHDAKNSVDASVHYLAKAIINQALAIDPDIVYIGGGISKNKKFMSLLNHEIIRIMRDSEQPKLFKVAACHGGNDANLYGALSLIK